MKKREWRKSQNRGLGAKEGEINMCPLNLGRTSEEKRIAICIDVKDVLVIVFNSYPSNFQEFFKWVAEVRQREDSGQTLK
ncbi:hypothetical protein L1887_16614 [Cichorium endivia]|nr:hypothetical protein L1887_16614 [Cichorium endivia]